MEFDKLEGKIIVISSTSCPVCRELKEKVSKLENKSDYVFLDVEESREAKNIVNAFKINAVPTMLTVVKEEGKTLLCKLDSNECLEIAYGEPGE